MEALRNVCNPRSWYPTQVLMLCFSPEWYCKVSPIIHAISGNTKKILYVSQFKLWPDLTWPCLTLKSDQQGLKLFFLCLRVECIFKCFRPLLSILVLWSKINSSIWLLHSWFFLSSPKKYFWSKKLLKSEILWGFLISH